MVYDFKVKDTNGKEVSLSEYKGKVLLIVNTATACGLTPQYEGLQKLYEKIGNSQFEILDFPCNQFFNQAPGTNEEIAQFCATKYHTTFKTFGKIDVNGDDADPLYKYLKVAADSANEDEDSLALYAKLEEHGFKALLNSVKWNFSKFLVNKKGEVVARYAPTHSPEKLEEDILKLINE